MPSVGAACIQWLVRWRRVCKGQVPLLQTGTLLKGRPSARAPCEAVRLAQAFGVTALHTSFSLCPMLLPSLAVPTPAPAQYSPINLLQVNLEVSQHFQGMTCYTDSIHWAPAWVQLSSARHLILIPTSNSKTSPFCFWPLPPSLIFLFSLLAL